MMTLEELEKKLTELDDLRSELKTQITELKAQKEEKPTPPHPRWKPDNGGSYYAIGNSDFGFYPWTDNGWSACLWSNSPIDEFNYAIGRVCHTEKEALEEIERLKVLAEMREWAGHNYDGAYIYYHRPSDELLIGWSGDSTYCFGDIRFKCIDDAEKCIKAVGKDRIKKYYFGIPDDEKEEETDDRK